MSKRIEYVAAVATEVKNQAVRFKRNNQNIDDSTKKNTYNECINLVAHKNNVTYSTVGSKFTVGLKLAKSENARNQVWDYVNGGNMLKNSMTQYAIDKQDQIIIQNL